ncbi:MAG TPA: alpha-glucosidase/alpha-galactosidase [Myxococcota bacterium]|nr:alpha-glucosidase/alpha-galactosidase [Myxococcota bacterium]
MSAPGKKIVFIGGGSTQFAPGLIADFIRTKDLQGGTIVLVDLDADKLETVYQLGLRLIEAGRADYSLEWATDRRAALSGADFVIVSVEIERMATWEQDRTIPEIFGIRQALGENGGPGGLFHALRQIPPIVEICRDIERLCPGALVLNLSNPMSRILQAVYDNTKVDFVGLCHEIAGGNDYLAQLLGRPKEDLTVVAAGLNHFSWYLRINDARTGEDLYPRVRDLVPSNVNRDRLLVADMLRLTGYLSITGDSHMGEYLKDGHIRRSSWAPEIEPLDFFAWYMAYMKVQQERIAELVAGTTPAASFLDKPSGEIVTDIISAVVCRRKQGFDAFNLPNDGYIPNLPKDCIVEVPGWIDGEKFGGRPVEPLPDVLAALCGRQAAIQKLCARAAMDGDRRAALEALLLDPIVPDRFVAEKCLEAMLEANRAYLPRFFD